MVEDGFIFVETAVVAVDVLTELGAQDAKVINNSDDKKIVLRKLISSQQALYSKRFVHYTLTLFIPCTDTQLLNRNT